MLCEKCRKRAASVRVTQYINGEKTALNLCEQCAVEKGMDSTIGFQDFFKGLIDMAMGFEASQQTKRSRVPDAYKCPECGLTYEEFRQIGKLGCAACYETFRSQIKPLIKSIHGSTEHMGKTPKKAGIKILRKREIQELKRNLATAIENEEYEEAAKLRDRMRDITRQGEVSADEMV